MSSRNSAPRLGSALIARKGEAAPTVPLTAPDENTQAVALANVPTLAAPAAPLLVASPPTPRGTAGTIAVTVRLDPERYERLKIYGAKGRRTNQDIMVEALDAYLALKA